MKIQKKLMSVMATVLMSIMMVFSAVAATGDYRLDFNDLKATVSVTGSSFTDESFGLVLKSVDNAPMPSGAENGMKTYSTGVLNSDKRSETIEFGSIVYEAPGVYEYTLTQNAGSTANMGYDGTTYHIHVKVYNKDDASGLKLEAMWVSKNDSSEKLDSISFENVKSSGSTSGGTSGGGSGSGGGGGVTEWHSVNPSGGTGSTESGSVLGASRGPIGDIIEAIAESPVGQVLGATRKAVQTGDTSMMAVMGCGFLACLAVFVLWFGAWRKRKAEQ